MSSSQHRNYRRKEQNYIWLMAEILIVLGGGIAIALIASSVFGTNQPAPTPVQAVSPVLTAITETATPPPMETLTATIAPTSTAGESPRASLTTPMQEATAETTAPTQTGSAPTATPPPTIDPQALCQEPNDGFDRAFGPLYCSGQPYRCLIWPTNDLSDFYFFELDTPGTVTVTLRDLPPGTNLDLFLFDRNRALLSASQNGGQATEEISYQAGADRYYIVVRTASGAHETLPYTLEITCADIAEPTPDVAIQQGCVEPNNSFAMAQGPIPCGETLACSLEPTEGDFVDIYYVDLPEATQLDLLLTDIPEGRAWRLHLYGASQEQLAASDNEGTLDEVIRQDVEAGRYYIAVLAPSTSAPSGGYTLRINCPQPGAPTPTTQSMVSATWTPTQAPTPAQPCDEPNDTFNIAYGPLNCGQSISCQMDPPAGDLFDIFYVDVQQPGIIRFLLNDMPKNVDWDLSLYDANGNDLDFSGGVLNEEELIELRANPGRYYIAVEVIEQGLPAGGYTLTMYCEGLPTATSTHTYTPTDTATPTRTASWTRTPSKTRTPSRTRTKTPTKTGTRTRTPSRTKTPTKTKTPSRTKSPTRTKTPTWTATWTPTDTATATYTATDTTTVTETPTITATSTDTATPTVTDTSTWTPTITLTSTPTETHTPTHTFEATSTPTGTIAISGVIGEAAAPIADGGQQTTFRWRAMPRPQPAPLTPWLSPTNRKD